MNEPKNNVNNIRPDIINTNTVSLYHGGSKIFLDSLEFGLDINRSFYCSTDKTIAERAAYDYSIDGRVKEIIIPQLLFLKAKEKKLFIERPYMGYLSEGSREVVIQKGEGIDLINDILFWRGKIPFHEIIKKSERYFGGL